MRRSWQKPATWNHHPSRFLDDLPRGGAATKSPQKHKNRHKTDVYFTLLYTKPGVKNNKFSERGKTRKPLRL